MFIKLQIRDTEILRRLVLNNNKSINHFGKVRFFSPLGHICTKYNIALTVLDLM